MLRNEIEGNCIPGVGCVVLLIQVLHRELGHVQPGTGHVKVPVKYRALVFKPLVGEVMDTVITECSELGILSTCGPLQTFVTLSHLGNFTYDNGSWVDRETNMVLKPNVEVRQRITGVKYQVHMIAAVGVIDQDYLGPLCTEL